MFLQFLRIILLELYSAIVSVVVWEIRSDNWAQLEVSQEQRGVLYLEYKWERNVVLGNMNVYEYKYVVPSFYVQ